MKWHLLIIFTSLFFLNTNAQNLEDLSQQLLIRQIQNKSTEEIEKKLSNISLEQLSNSLKTDTHKKTFWINIYNGFIIKKIKANPESYQKRSSFFSKRDIPIAGQLFSFEPDYWTNWKKGDIIFFEWQHTPHSTANTGFKDRPLLKITGTLKDENWIMKAKNTGEITHFVYD